ncbi:MAG: MFS transporter [Candidatus Thorarchaeota archaeon]
MQLSNDSEVSEVKRIIDPETKRFREFLFFFSGQNVSFLGSSIVSFAIIWWLTVTTQSELMLGIASLVSLGPYIFAAPVSGVLADRLNRKMLLIVLDAAQALLTVTLSILFLTNNISIAIILVILGLRGTAQAFHQPVDMAIVPTMVPQKHLSRINGASYLFGGLINIIGPVVGASLLAIPGVNIGMILWIDVITFGIALIPLLIVKIPSVARKTLEVKEEKKSFFAEFAEGFTALKSTKGMIALLFGAMTINFFLSPLMALLPLFVNKVHGGNEVNYATVIGMLQAAIVVGGLIMSFFKGFKKPVLFLLFSVTFQAVCQIALTFIPTDFSGRFWTIGGILFCFALPFAIIDVTFITSIQLMIPREKLGRVIATIMAISPAIRPLGQFLSGIIAEFVGINLVLIVSAILTVVSLLTIYLLTPMRKLDSEINRILTEAKESKNIDSLGMEHSDEEIDIVLNEKVESDFQMAIFDQEVSAVEVK